MTIIMTYLSINTVNSSNNDPYPGDILILFWCWVTRPIRLDQTDAVKVIVNMITLQSHISDWVYFEGKCQEFQEKSFLASSQYFVGTIYILIWLNFTDVSIYFYVLKHRLATVIFVAYRLFGSFISSHSNWFIIYG